ncbi:MAG: alanine--tRNA ligase [Candidatus Omnitrophota bacterium]|nr:alanine--tRNA ligase [Candidatus Omnitrophota bacterium]
MKADLLREKFLRFFKARKHRVIESDSLVPRDDPTVLFTPAGMNQFKEEFLGYNRGFSRAATAQRCLRTDDLDKVGKTAGHHTFFEMLGNFSFGDYFKKEAITWAWEFLTAELKIDQGKLWVSVYKEDQESYDIWKDLIKIPPGKIIKLGDKENFWPSEAKQKGPDGPCGPCSEIFFDTFGGARTEKECAALSINAERSRSIDFGKEAGCGKPDCKPGCSCGRFVEIWNLVFTQFNRRGEGKLEPLPKKNIDTGMGLERLAAVMQGVHSNFETDLFVPIIKEIRLDSRTQELANSRTDELIYAVADHLRAIVFAIYDGVLPSNETRGYVVRKLIRKSIIHLRTLGIEKPFLYKLVPVLAEIMKAPYPQLLQRRENIAEIILAEEKNFISTLNSSENLFKEKFAGFSGGKDAQKAGKIAFVLYDTYGIPLELTADWLKKNQIPISKEAFDQELIRQKNRSKSQSAMKGDVFTASGIDYAVKETKFLGYKENSLKAKVLKIINPSAALRIDTEDGVFFARPKGWGLDAAECIKSQAEVKKLNAGEEAAIILDKSVFYPESGGQVGDTGELAKGKSVFEVLDTRKADKVILHIGRVKSGSFKKNDFINARINLARRRSIAANHTATHLLQAALRKVLGAHVQQQGSQVSEDRLRFDFTHFKDLTREELNRVEESVNNYILRADVLIAKEMELSQARKSGALAFFAEKYADKVRVVSIGDFSRELCAGTHLENTAQIGIFKIIHEGSVASGVRRIEAVTGNYVYKLVKEQQDIILEISTTLNVPAQKITEELKKKTALIKELEKQLNLQMLDSLKSSLDNIIAEAVEIKGTKVVTKVMENTDMGLLRKTVDLIKEKVNNAVIALGSTQAGRVLLVIGVTPDLVQKGIDASGLIRDIAGMVGGSGGGRKDFAQAGGNKPEELQKALQELKNTVARLL